MRMDWLSKAPSSFSTDSTHMAAWILLHVNVFAGGLDFYFFIFWSP